MHIFSNELLLDYHLCFRAKENSYSYLLLLDNCESSPDIGSCSEKYDGKMIIMWYWDGHSDSCKKFGYSGCGGNGNRYKTLAACRKWCGMYEFLQILGNFLHCHYVLRYFFFKYHC